MQPREKRLATALGAVVAAALVFYVVWPLTSSVLFGTIRDRDADIASLQSQVQSREDQELAVMRATRNLAQWRRGSLPPDPLTAQRVYQSWLNDVVQQCGWQNAKIENQVRNATTQAYAPIAVQVTGNARLDQVEALLARLESSALQQQVRSLDIKSPSFNGDPLLEVTVVVEGLAMRDAALRRTLFPQTGLVKAIDDKGETLQVRDDPIEDAAAAVRLQIDQELLAVKARKGTQWTVQRGIGFSTAAAHAENAVVEIEQLRPDSGASDAPRLIVDRLFTKPRPQTPSTPKLVWQTVPAAVRGQKWELTLTLEDWDTRLGSPKFAIAEGPAGMTIDPQSAVLSWLPAEDAETKTYTVDVVANGRNTATVGARAQVSVALKRKNDPPKMTAPATVSVWLGQPLTVAFQADDPDFPEEKLAWSMTGDLPPEARLDPSTGALSWTPSVDLPAGEKRIEVIVTDAGDPPATDKKSVVLQLKDDAAHYTHLVGLIKQGSDLQAWLQDRSSNQRTVLKPGDTFQIADIAGKMTAVEAEYIDFESDGDLYRLLIGDNLRQRRKIASATAPPASDPPSTEATSVLPHAGESAPSPSTESSPPQAD